MLSIDEILSKPMDYYKRKDLPKLVDVLEYHVLDMCKCPEISKEKYDFYTNYLKSTVGEVKQKFKEMDLENGEPSDEDIKESEYLLNECIYALVSIIEKLHEAKNGK